MSKLLLAKYVYQAAQRCHAVVTFFGTWVANTDSFRTLAMGQPNHVGLDPHVSWAAIIGALFYFLSAVTLAHFIPAAAAKV
ncbi:MAG TPA: hypothetical protein VFU37_18410 [Pyrinomonadaceae bacterium]|nr:hypothetical protein [Pyrinomonadaceae bacterium]